MDFYPRSPCGERHQQIKNGYRTISFLSTLSLRRATGYRPASWSDFRDFYPRSPCGERLELFLYYQDNMNFYPRSPCGERLKLFAKRFSNSLFLSTLSLRRATLRVVDGSKSSIISIHALLAESDTFPGFLIGCIDNFYPRSPCGERPPPAPQGKSSNKFLSTLSLRRATPLR